MSGAYGSPCLGVGLESPTYANGGTTTADGSESGWKLTLCMNTLGPHFAIPASGTVEVLPFSPLLPSPPAVWRSKGEGGWGGEVT